jgi:two-component system, chemotaxis family, CheB/CheR fusion protein
MTYDHAGKTLMLLGVIQDITEQKTFADGLKKLVQERTEELQALNEELVVKNEELIESNSHFIRLNKELEQFAYVASHDLQEPLRKIQIFANILNQRYTDELSADAAVYMEKITASASRMSNLIKDLLDYSRLSYNSSLFKAIDLNVVVKHVINDFELLISQKGVSVNVDQLPSIEAIPIQMNQLFYNIIGNSIKFSKKTVKPVITITSRILRAEEIKQFPSLKFDKDYLQVAISDNGIGFSQQYAEQIFTIFNRLNDKSKYGGYGIGLALCKRIVENHNGIIVAKGTENEGATFIFVLPMEH